MKKNYVVDSNVLLNDAECITKLRNGEENNVFIPLTVIKELDGLKKDARVSHLVIRAVHNIIENIDKIKILGNDEVDTPDLKILEEIKNNRSSFDSDPILITDDNILRIISKHNNIECEQYKNAIPYLSESQKLTGFLETKDENPEDLKNFFVWENGFPVFYKHNSEPKIIDYKNQAWKVTPKMKNKKEWDIHQNLALELLLDDDVQLMSLQGNAGHGKTFLSLAVALQKVLEKTKERDNKYKKIILVKPTIESSESLGFLPGDLSEKMAPYLRYLTDLLDKLNTYRDLSRIYKKNSRDYDTKVFEVLAPGYIRGMNIENAFVIIDEAQNFSRDEIKTILTRMCDNTKVVLLGDTSQVDNVSSHRNQHNNGMNWVVKALKDNQIYAHMVLQGYKSRGPITDAVLNSIL